MSSENRYAYEVPGKLEIPYKYFAGECGSRFLTTLRDQKKIMATRCPQCKAVFMPPRSVCTRCYQRIEDWVEAGPAGTVTSYTVVRYWEPHMPYHPPFVMAMIKLDGADTELTHLIRETDPDDVHIGMRVEPVWADKRRAHITDIVYFRPVTKKKPGPRKKAAARKKAGKAVKKKKAAKKKKAKKAAGRLRVKKAAVKKRAAKKKGAKKAAKKAVKRARKAGRKPGRKAAGRAAKKQKKKVVKKAGKKAAKKAVRKAARKKAKKSARKRR